MYGFYLFYVHVLVTVITYLQLSTIIYGIPHSYAHTVHKWNTSRLFNTNIHSRQFLKYGLPEYLKPVCVFKIEIFHTMTPSFVSVYTLTMAPESNIRSDSANFNSN